MPFVQHTMQALIRVDPKRAKKILLSTFRKAKANRTDAAKILGCTNDTFVHWAVALGIRAEIDALEKEALAEGWHHGKNRVGRRKTG